MSPFSAIWPTAIKTFLHIIYTNFYLSFPTWYHPFPSLFLIFTGHYHLLYRGPPPPPADSDRGISTHSITVAQTPLSKPRHRSSSSNSAVFDIHGPPSEASQESPSNLPTPDSDVADNHPPFTIWRLHFILSTYSLHGKASWTWGQATSTSETRSRVWWYQSG